MIDCFCLLHVFLSVGDFVHFHLVLNLYMKFSAPLLPVTPGPMLATFLSKSQIKKVPLFKRAQRHYLSTIMCPTQYIIYACVLVRTL